MQESKWNKSTAIPLVFVALALIGLSAPISPAALAASETESPGLATSLLVMFLILSVCILVVSGFTLWQSHRYYLDTVTLSRETTATTTELHRKVVELIYSLKDFLAHESEVAKLHERRPSRTQSQGSKPREAQPRGAQNPGDQPQEAQARESKDAGRIVQSINETESKIKALEKTLDRLNEQLSLNFQAADLPRKLSALGDTEYAVLLKLSQDPRFFEKHSFTSFGATPKVLDSLLSRQLIVFDKDGKAEVPKEVVLALKYSAPRN
ncbi:hypothetical protein HZA56_00400 [Candidatus Poribacteria bacterium]|nr:hypothetical protein [Candidatus Poribacteria bacterium]